MDNQIYYHITPRRNYDSIMKLGLIPKFEKGLCGNPSYNVLFFTNNPSTIIEKQAGVDWCKRNDAIVLLCEVEPVPVIYWWRRSGKQLSDFEFIADECKPEQIVDFHEIHRYYN